MNAPGGNGALGRRLMVAAGLVVAGAVVAALFVMDPPSRQRAERLDRIRVEHLQVLAQRIDMHAEVHDRMPAQLSVVARAPGHVLVDPATGRPYQYEVTGERTYRLCATFETSPDGPAASMPVRDEWRHGEGRQCFDREVRAVERPGVPVPAVR